MTKRDEDGDKANHTERRGPGTIGLWAILAVGCALGAPDAYEWDAHDTETLLGEFAAEDAERVAGQVEDEDGVVLDPTLEERALAFSMADEDLSADFNDRDSVVDLLAIAGEGTTHLDEEELAEIAAWDDAHADSVVTGETLASTAGGRLDWGEGPAQTGSHARGRILRVTPDGTVVGWACDRRNPGQPVVALVTVRNDEGIRMRAPVLADEVPMQKWARRMVRERCGDTQAHLFRVHFDREIGCANRIALSLVGPRDGQRYFVRRERLRCGPIGNVFGFKVDSRRLRGIRGFACDHERPDRQVMVTVESSRTGRLRQRRTSSQHGRRVHMRCLGGERHRFEFSFDRDPPPCGTSETIRVFAHNLGDRGPNRVLIGKRKIQGRDCPTGGGGSGYGSDFSAGAPTWGGCRYVTNEVISIVNANGGYPVTSRKRSETFGNPSSDHYVGNSLADAVDFGTDSNFSLAQTIRSRLSGGSHSDYATFTIRRAGHTFRGQLIAGTHGTGPHLHFGCQRID